MHSTYAVSRVEYLQPEVPVMTADILFILYSINPNQLKMKVSHLWTAAQFS